MWVQRRFIGLLRLVKSELVVVAVLRSIQLLNQEHNSIMDNPQHPQTIHTWNKKQSTTNTMSADLEQEDTAACHKELGHHTAVTAVLY